MYKHLTEWEHYYHIYHDQWINIQATQSNVTDECIEQVLSFDTHEVRFFYSYDPQQHENYHSSYLQS